MYRMTRSAAAWFELFDIDSGTLTDPVVIASGYSVGLTGAYRSSMSMSPAFGSNGILYMPVFDTIFASLTPAVDAVDVSGALP